MKGFAKEGQTHCSESGRAFVPDQPDSEIEHYYYSAQEFDQCPYCGERTRWDGVIGRNVCPGSNGAEFDRILEYAYP